VIELVIGCGLEKRELDPRQTEESQEQLMVRTRGAAVLRA